VCSYLPLHPTLLTSSSSSLNEITRKGAKSKNTQGSPIKLTSKILAAIPDPQDDDHIYVAEAAGNVKRINIEVGQTSFTFPLFSPCSPFHALTTTNHL
jgi:hypothetical protein